jgi:hypothetical protein
MPSTSSIHPHFSKSGKDGAIISGLAHVANPPAQDGHRDDGVQEQPSHPRRIPASVSPQVEWTLRPNSERLSSIYNSRRATGCGTWFIGKEGCLVATGLTTVSGNE